MLIKKYDIKMIEHEMGHLPHLMFFYGDLDHEKHEVKSDVLEEN